MKLISHRCTNFCDITVIIFLLITTPLPTICSATSNSTAGGQSPFEIVIVREDESGSDLNNDGDTNDQILHVTNTLLSTSFNLGFAIAGPTIIQNNLIAFHVDETASGNLDLNGDGDTNDLILHVYDFITDSTVNLKLAGTFLRNIQIPNRLAFGVREESQGLDLNGDGDTADFILHIYNTDTGQITNTGLATLDYRIAGNGHFIAFQVPEFSQGLDLNGDQVFADNILHVYDTESSITTNVQLTSNFKPVISENLVGFHVYEGQDGVDLNNDGDAEDSVLHVYDTQTGNTTNYGLVPFNPPMAFRSIIPSTVPPDFKVAFIGDQGLGPDSVAVLQLISNERADMVLHQGDFEYTDNPDAWEQQINSVLGANFPYFASVGNHDVSAWPGYQQKLINRLARVPGASCTGVMGINTRCTYQGLFFVLSGAGTLGSDHEAFLNDELTKDRSIWRICSWHKNMNKMQVGNKSNATGWPVYEACKKAGAMIVTGHEHSYERTKTLTNIEFQTIDPDWTKPDEVRLATGASFVTVSGLAGRNVRNQDRCLPTTFPYGCKGEWASIYTSDQNAQFGALFCTFYINGQPDKAHCYFKDIDGNIPDQFNITSFMGGPPEPDITVTPESFNYPDTPAGNSESGTFQIRNNGDRILDVTSISITGIDQSVFSITSGGVPFMLSPGQTHDVVVDFRPISEGNKNAALSITSNDPDESSFDVLLTGATPSVDVTLEDVMTGGVTRSAIVSTSGNVIAVNGHLYLAAITSKSFKPVTSVTGLGLTWTRLESQCSGRNTTGVDIWMAQGTTNASGPVTATLSGLPSNATIAVSRYSGVDTNTPVGRIVSGNTNGVGGICSGGIDTNNYSFNMTTSVNGSTIYGAVAMRHRNHIPGTGFTEKLELVHGTTGGSKSSLAIMDQLVENPSTVSLTGRFNNNVDYAVIGIEIIPVRTPVPDITVTPASHDYGIITIGNSASFSFEVSNNSCTALHVLSPSLTGSSPGAFNIDSSAGEFTLNPGQAQNIIVSFNPTTTETKTAVLRIPSNDPDENPFDVPLSGNSSMPIEQGSSIDPLNGNTYAVDVNNSYAYVGAGEQLIVFNVTNPAAPFPVGKVNGLGDSVQDIQIIGNLAFLATGTTGLHIIDVSNPHQPLKINDLDTTGFANGLFALNDYVYIAAGGAGLLIIDVSDPANPVQVATSNTSGWDNEVFVANGYAYIASEEEGVRALDVSDPTAPLDAGSIQTRHDAIDVFVADNLLFIAAGSGGLQILDISDPLVPTEVSAVDTGYARKVIADNGFAYIATERDGVLVMDVTNPANPRRVNLFHPIGSANSIDVAGDYIYVADGVGGLLVINVSSGRTNEQCREFSPVL